MRQLIIKRINELKTANENFSKSLMRWQNFQINGKHISEIKFEDFNDEVLLTLYERIVIRHCKQM